MKRITTLIASGLGLMMIIGSSQAYRTYHSMTIPYQNCSAATIESQGGPGVRMAIKLNSSAIANPEVQRFQDYEIFIDPKVTTFHKVRLNLIKAGCISR